MSEARQRTEKELRRRAEKQRRRRFLLDAAPFTEHAAVGTVDAPFFVRTDDTGVGTDVFVKGGSRNDTKVLRRTMGYLAGAGLAMPLGGLFVDIGANIGTTTVAALRRQGFAAGVAVEPSPRNFDLLRVNLVAAGLDGRVVTINAAAGAHPGSITLDVSDTNTGGHHVDEGPADSGTRVAVPMVTLDSLIAEGTVDVAHTSLVWIDAQGYDLEVLEGASVLLGAGVPVVAAFRAEQGDRMRAGLPALVEDRYTDVVNLRGGEPMRPLTELPAVLASLHKNSDLLFLRRG
jgi:FkbM family methyltransferase